MTAEGVSGWAEAGSADVVVAEFRAFLAGERGSRVGPSMRGYGPADDNHEEKADGHDHHQ